MSSSGANNPNSLDITNERLLTLGIKCVNHLGHIPNSREFKDYAESVGERIPKGFSNYRFGGFRGFQDLLIEKTGKSKLPVGYKSEQHKENLSNSVKGFNWYSSDILKKSIQSRDFSALSENEKWYKGRKYGKS